MLFALALYGAAPDNARAQGCGPQNPNCIVATAPPGTSNNQSASTAFVQNAFAGGGNLPLANGKIYIGSVAGVAAAQSLSGAGDCSVSLANNGVATIICTKTNGTAFGALATLGLTSSFTSAGGNLNLASTITAAGPVGSSTTVPIITYNAFGQLTAVGSAAIAGSAYTAPWTSAIAYPQAKVNANTVYMTDFMGTATCDGTLSVGGTGGVSTTTLTIASVQQGPLKAGQIIAGTGIANGTTIIAQLTGPAGGAGTYQMSQANTVTTGTTLAGGTDQATNINNFLAAVALNGQSYLSVTGIFAQGVCFVSSADPTFTINSARYPINYRLLGYGTTIFPDPGRQMTGFSVVRGTFLQIADQQRSATIEGLSLYMHNNGNALWGFNVADGHVNIEKTACLAGDDGGGNVPHNSGNFACYYYHQIDPTDPNTGPFYGKLIQNDCTGAGTGATGVPFCIRFDGSVNAMVVRDNHLALGATGIFIHNPCATVNNNCAYTANGVVITGNNIENFATCVTINTNVPTLTAITGGEFSSNTFEGCSTAALDISTVTQASNVNSELAWGPNTLLAPIGASVLNPNSITIKQF